MMMAKCARRASTANVRALYNYAKCEQCHCRATSAMTHTRARASAREHSPSSLFIERRHTHTHIVHYAEVRVCVRVCCGACEISARECVLLLYILCCWLAHDCARVCVCTYRGMCSIECEMFVH